jgi:hypothetical protein
VWVKEAKNTELSTVPVDILLKWKSAHFREVEESKP